MMRTWVLVGLGAAAAAIVGCSSTGHDPDAGAGTGGKTGSGGLPGEMGGRTGTGGLPGEIGGRTGSGGSNDGGSNDSVQFDGGGDASVACSSAVAQGVCTSEGAVCSSGCTDVCQFCNLLRCVSGRWQPQEVAPAACFACGPTLRCQTNAQFCRVQMGGAVGIPPSYQCRATPDACRPTPSCQCLRNQGVAETLCAEGDAGTGQITTTLLAP